MAGSIIGIIKKKQIKGGVLARCIYRNKRHISTVSEYRTTIEDEWSKACPK